MAAVMTGCSASHCGEPATLADVGADAPVAAACTTDRGHVYLAEVPVTGALTVMCEAPGSAATVELYGEAAGHTGPFLPPCVPGTGLFDLGPVRAGRYFVTLEYAGQPLAGGTLLGAPECPSSTSPYCAPIEMDVRPCATTVVPFSTRCPPGVSDCGGGA